MLASLYLWDIVGKGGYYFRIRKSHIMPSGRQPLVDRSMMEGENIPHGAPLSHTLALLPLTYPALVTTQGQTLILT